MKMLVETDTHIHTTVSDCCEDLQMTAENIAVSAWKRGLKMIAITDHIWANTAVPCNEFYKVHPEDKLVKHAESIRKGEYPIPVLAGCEADMRAPGEFGITKESREKFDLVLLSSDHFHMTKFVEQAESDTPAAWAKQMMRFFRSAANSGLADILVHPMFLIGHVEHYDKAIGTIPDSELLEMFAEAAEKRVAMEINTAVVASAKRGEFSEETMIRLFSLAKLAGCKFTFGSDAHNISDFDSFSLAETFAEKLELTKNDLFDFSNILTLAKEKKGGK